MPYTKSTLVAFLALAFVVAGNPARADEEEGVPSFKTTTKRETEEFVKKVGTAIVKAARAKPGSVELVKYKYTTPKTGRTELKIDMTYKGTITRKVFKVDITVLIDSSTKDAWEVLNIDYKDDNKTSLLGPSVKSIQALIKQFNK